MAQKVSNFWFLVPILLGWLGGVIAFFAVKGRDENKARNLFLVGIGISIGVFVLSVGLPTISSGTLIPPLSFLT